MGNVVLHRGAMSNNNTSVVATDVTNHVNYGLAVFVCGAFHGDTVEHDKVSSFILKNAFQREQEPRPVSQDLDSSQRI